MYHLAMSEEQNFKNHGRIDPPMHFFITPVLLINVIVMTVAAVNHRHHNLPYRAWLVFVAVALLTLALKSRAYGLKIQDRVIRLEEQLRYTALLPAAGVSASSALTMRQIIALRFASDAELPGLVARTLTENLAPKQIKQSIVTWRPDIDRV